MLIFQHHISQLTHVTLHKRATVRAVCGETLNSEDASHTGMASLTELPLLIRLSEGGVASQSVSLSEGGVAFVSVNRGLCTF